MLHVYLPGTKHRRYLRHYEHCQSSKTTKAVSVTVFQKSQKQSDAILDMSLRVT